MHLPHDTNSAVQGWRTLRGMVANQINFRDTLWMRNFSSSGPEDLASMAEKDKNKISKKKFYEIFQITWGVIRK